MKNTYRNLAVTVVLITSTTGFASGAMAASKEQGSSHGKPFLSLQEQIDQTRADLDALAASNATAIQALQAAIADLQNQINGLQSQIDANDLEIAGLQTQAGDNADAIADLQTANANLQSQIDDLGTALADKQDVLDGNGCPAGSSLRVIYPDGGYLCEVDDDTITKVSRTVRYSGSRLMTSYLRQYAVTAACPGGWLPTGGGARMSRSGTRYSTAITESIPYGNTGWRTEATILQYNRSNYVRAVVNCLRIFN